MFDYIENEELKKLLIQINNEDKIIENMGSSIKLIKLLNEENKQYNQEQLVKDILNNDKIKNYFKVWVKDINMSILTSNSELAKIIKMMIDKSDYNEFKIIMFKIYSKLKFEGSIYLAMKMKNNEIQEEFFEILFNEIKNDCSLRNLMNFATILKRKPNEFKEGIIFDFIDLLYNIDLSNEQYRLIDDLRGTLGTRDENIREELVKLKHKKYKLSREYMLIDDIISNQKVNLDNIDKTLLILSISSKNTKDIIKILEFFKDKTIFEELINSFIGSNDKDIDKSKVMQILKAKKMCINEIQESFVNEYIKQNNIEMHSFEKEYCKEDYINNKINLINNYLYEEEIDKIKDILKQENNQDILTLISIKCIENMLDNNQLSELIEVWEKFKLSVNLTSKYGEKIKELIINNNEINENTVKFLSEINLDDMSLYKNIKSEESKMKLLDIWAKNNKNGKILDIIKNKIDTQLKTVEDLKNISKIISRYNVNDDTLKKYLNLKVYSKLELELLELNISDSNDGIKLDSIIYLVIEYNLESRLLNDDYLLKIVGKEIEDSIARKIINKSQKEEVLEAFWNRVDDAIRIGRIKLIKDNIKIILPYIIESDKKIEWFLDLLSDKKYERDVLECIIDVCLETMKQNKRIINQLNKELIEVRPQVNLEIASSIGVSIAELEKSIINIKDKDQRDIIIKMIKKLRTSLARVGIKTAEEIDNYNKIVELDEDKHSFKGNSIKRSGLIESLGVKVNDEIIYRSMMSEIVEDEIIG